MNKTFCRVSATLMGVLLLLTLGSCSKESQLIPEAQPEAGAGQLAFSLDNDALRSVPAEDFEKAVDEHSVWCVFLTSAGSGAQTVQTAKPAYKTPAGNYSVNAGFVGAAQMFVIGNVESDLQSKLYNLTSGTTLEQVQKWIVKNSLGNGTTDPAKFVMTSDLVNVTLPAVGAAPTNLSTPIVLKRLAARFDVINEVPGLKLTTVSVANRIITSTLLDVQQTGEKATAATEYNITDGKVLLHKIYSYQNSNKGGTQDATSFTIQGTYNGKAIKPISVKLQDATTTEALDVQRNHCYRILLKPAGDDFNPIKPDDPSTAWKIVVKVLDWNEVADLGNYSDEDLDNQGNVPDQTINPSGVNLLGAVAEYNLDVSGTQFVTTHSNKAGISGYFNWAEAMALKMPNGYHLPTVGEWAAIMGDDEKNTSEINFTTNGLKTDFSIKVQIPGQSGTMDCKQDVKRVSTDHATYMIRYKDDDIYRSAWRYSYVSGPIVGQKVLKIESVTVKDNLTIDKLSKDYFAKPGVKEYVKRIYLPTTGWNVSKDGSGAGRDRGICAFAWSASENTSSTAFRACFNNIGAYVDNDNAKTDRYAVRPFRDKLQ